MVAAHTLQGQQTWLRAAHTLQYQQTWLQAAHACQIAASQALTRGKACKADRVLLRKDAQQHHSTAPAACLLPLQPALHHHPPRAAAARCHSASNRNLHSSLQWLFTKLQGFALLKTSIWMQPFRWQCGRCHALKAASDSHDCQMPCQ